MRVSESHKMFIILVSTPHNSMMVLLDLGAAATIWSKSKHRKDCYILVDHQNTKFKCAISSFGWKNSSLIHMRTENYFLFFEMFTLTRHKLNYTINLSVLLFFSVLNVRFSFVSVWIALFYSMVVAVVTNNFNWAISNG